MNVQEVSPDVRRRDETAIRRVLARARGCAITYVDEGWDSRVYLVDSGEVVFKFPRSPEVRAQYRHEIAALRMLERVASPVLTPRVRWEDPDLDYFGYAGVVGEPLSKVIADLETDEKTKLGVAIGRFLHLLHRAQLDDAPTMTIADEVSNYSEKYGLARPTLAAALSEDEMLVVERFFLQQLPTELTRFGGDLRLGHGDLGPWNMVVSPDRGLGVIDFGDVGYYDVSKDFSGFGDAAILDAAFDAYGAGGLLRDKAALRIKAFPVLDLPFYLGKRDRVGVDACLDLVRRVLIDGDASADARFKRHLRAQPMQ